MKEEKIEKIIKNFGNGINKQKTDNLKTQITSLKNLKPLTLLITPLFKITTLTLYFLKSKLFNSSISQVLTILIFSSIDYWLTKNFLGKKLTGLYFAKIFLKHENKIKYCYKDFGEKIEKKKINLMIFWFSQFLFMFFWMLILLFNFLRMFFFEFILSFFPFVLLLNLVYHFSRCLLTKEKVFGKFFQGIKKNVLINKKTKFFD